MARRAVSPHCFPALFRRMIFPLDVLPIETSYCASGTLFSHRRVTWRNSACSATIFSVFDRGAPPNANEWRSCVDYLRTCLAGRPFDMPRPHILHMRLRKLFTLSLRSLRRPPLSSLSLPACGVDHGTASSPTPPPKQCLSFQTRRVRRPGRACSRLSACWRSSCSGHTSLERTRGCTAL